MAKSDDPSDAGDVVTGLDGLFRGLGNVLKAAADLVDKADGPTEVSRTGSIGIGQAANASYGVSVRVAPARRPSFRRPSGVRREAPPSSREDFREPSTDVFDEDDHYLVIAELPGVTESAVQWRVHENLLTIEAQSGDSRYVKEVALQTPIKNATFALVNGVAEFRLWKQ